MHSAPSAPLGSSCTHPTDKIKGGFPSLPETPVPASVPRAGVWGAEVGSSGGRGPAEQEYLGKEQGAQSEVHRNDDYTFSLQRPSRRPFPAS